MHGLFPVVPTGDEGKINTIMLRDGDKREKISLVTSGDIHLRQIGKKFEYL